MKTIYSLGTALLLTGSAVMGLTGCNVGDDYSQSTGQYIDDKRTTSRVKDVLGHDGLYKYEHVNVMTFKGQVQLSGFVTDPGQKERAGTLAKTAQGVRDVVNNITVQE